MGKTVIIIKTTILPTRLQQEMEILKCVNFYSIMEQIQQ